jgi:catechol 2,3-dioxygenase-like lactoylglutathione lyase family enzyme
VSSSRKQSLNVPGILETCLYTHDLEATEEFYASILGLEIIGREEGRHVFFRCGPGLLLLFNPDRTMARDTDFPSHGARGPGHVAFAVANEDLPSWQDHLQKHGVEIEKEATWPTGGRSIYFRDPSGNSLELASPRIWSLSEALFHQPGAA